MKIFQRDVKGFTLFEMLLVLGIMSMIIVLITNYSTQKMDQLRRDKTAVQMEQILNAGMAFYLNQGYWPAQANSLAICTNGSPAIPLKITASGFMGSYLPASVNSPWYGALYEVYCNSSTGTFSVQLTLPAGTDATANATVIAGEIPMGTSSGAVVTGQVLVPGQDLNNARSVNFAGYYHNGACVPAPVCPPNMAQDILVVPVSLYGVNALPTTAAYYALYGFTAYAYGTAVSTGPPTSNPGPPSGIADCYNTNGSGFPTVTPCDSSAGVAITSTTYNYWRVCLSVTTENGVVALTSDSGWGQYATVMAITRCVPQNEYSGSDFSVWTR